MRMHFYTFWCVYKSWGNCCYCIWTLFKMDWTTAWADYQNNLPKTNPCASKCRASHLQNRSICMMFFFSINLLLSDTPFLVWLLSQKHTFECFFINHTHNCANVLCLKNVIKPYLKTTLEEALLLDFLNENIQLLFSSIMMAYFDILSIHTELNKL